MAVEFLPPELPIEYFVYAALCRDGDGPLYVKFGKTRRLYDRFNEIRRNSPVKPQHFAFVEVPNPKRQRKLELGLHRHFRDRLIKGEWFRFDADSIEDKRAFNDGSAEMFLEHLGQGFSWTKVSGTRIERMAEIRRATYLKSKGRKGLAREMQQELNKQEYAAYRGR